MRINLVCPYADRHLVKALGARWDVARQVWYIENVDDLTPFKRWIPEIAHWEEPRSKCNGRKFNRRNNPKSK